MGINHWQVNEKIFLPVSITASEKRKDSHALIIGFQKKGFKRPMLQQTVLRIKIEVGALIFTVR